jgi:SAM-dependent methyltransferase
MMADQGARVRHLAGRLRRRLGSDSSPTRSGSAVSGLVEEFSRRLVVGWVSVPEDAAPTRVDLFVNNLRLTSTYATPDSAMSGVNSVLRRGGQPAIAPEGGSDARVHHWQAPPIPGPADDRRNSHEQIRTFSFGVRGLWPYVRRGTRITVQVDGQPLPIHGHGMYLSPPARGKHTVQDLRAKLEQGYVFSQFGRVQLSKQLDHAWQQGVIDLYARVRAALSEEVGYEAWFVYGTLLGAVREGTYIGHDIDFDAAYVSRFRTGSEAAAELADIALALIARGFDVECHATALHIRDSEYRIDLFHTYFDEQGVLRFPFGIAGTSTLTEDDWSGTKEIDFPGGNGLIPVNGEQMVAYLYGDDWRQPKPGFSWALARTDHSPEGEVPEELRTKVYWANFYAHTHYTTGSTFFEWVAGRPDTPRTVIDIGCGDGRDSYAFGATGRTVLGLDQSPVGIEHAQSRAVSQGLTNVSFRVCDVADVDDLGQALQEVVDHASGPTLFYLRFFLHAIHEDVQQSLLNAIDTHARPDDMFAAEFRTDKDAHTSKVHTKHYRRFQEAAAFVSDLAGRGWEILHEEESSGLSPYKGEDPVLCRVVGRRRS